MDKNYYLAVVYRQFKWPLDFEFIEAQDNLRDSRDVREHFLFHPKLEAVNKCEIQRILDQSESELRYLQRKGWKVTYPGSHDYPYEFLHLSWPPIFLSYIGEPAWNTSNFIGVVGAREPTYDAYEWINTELPPVFEDGFGVISGAARGIDQAAHEVCIRMGKKTIAFLPTGLKYIYPKDFARYVPEIIEYGGAVVSEYLPSVPIHKCHFHERNRLIATMGQLLLVVQAKLKSGSLLTARYALQSGKSVAAVPWDPREIKAMGTNQLLFDGAQLIRNGHDLISLLHLEGCGFVNPTPVLQTKH